MCPKFHGLGWPSRYGSSAEVCGERFGPPTSPYTLGAVVSNTSPIHREKKCGFCVPIPVVGLVTTVGFYADFVQPVTSCDTKEADGFAC